MNLVVKKLEHFFAFTVVPYFRDKPSPVSLNYFDLSTILILLFLSFFTRFWLIFNPQEPVAYEINYMNKVFFSQKNDFYQELNDFYPEKRHHPLSSLIIALFGALSDFNVSNIYFHVPNSDEKVPQNQSNFENDNFIDGNYISFRVLMCLFSSFVPTLLYIAMRFASFNRIASFMSATMLIFDTSLICDGRFANPNSFFSFFSTLSLCFMTHWFSLFRNNQKWKKHMLFTSLSIGFAVSVKTTAYSLLFVLFFHEIIYLFIEFDCKLNKAFFKATLKRFTILTIPTIVVHISIWILYLSFLQNSQELNKNWYNFHSKEAQTADKLHNSIKISNLSPFNTFRLLLSLPSFVRKATHENKLMDNHSPSFPGPSNWIFMRKLDPALWEGTLRHIIFIGNFFVYIFAACGVFLAIFYTRNRKYFRSATFVVTYLFTYLSFLFGEDDEPASNYLLPLICGVACFGISMDMMLNSYVKGFIMVVYVSIAYLGYVEWSPIVFGEELSFYQFEKRMWRDGWS
ncbi:hypothetical protein TRFO_29267 [Tritrichomonas foetus]|uniref:Uncharacterized protein n=1 Tax=Tritrichomonas foetus TaxID=1144522 RepID=A0A1J4JXF6_9EUKA|nr:hypothetical protein TRFO_29267 [Tritrichomonas foetus]|eukprot:OHT03346.1 hypothetical protein TRFO_29267 [Tritrichomonas foetus]